MDAGEGFAPPMIRAYETGLLATLPAITIQKLQLKTIIR
jgi:hypothetical protein